MSSMHSAASPQLFECAAREAAQRFGLAPSRVDFVHLSENATYRIVDGPTGNRFALRLHRPSLHSLDELKSERIWTSALAAAGVDVPRPLRLGSGEEFVSIELAETGESRWVSMAQWLDGELMSDAIAAARSPAALCRYFSNLGELIARAHNQASEWVPPPDFRRSLLDAEGLMGEAPVWGPFWLDRGLQPHEQKLMLRARDLVGDILRQHRRDADNFSVIHADLHPGNVIEKDGRLSMIDFDDAAFGWHLYDLAVAMLWYRLHPSFEKLLAACIGGYRRARSLAEEDLEQLPLFMLARGMAQLGWFYERPEVAEPAQVGILRQWVCTAASALVEGRRMG